MAEFEKPIWGAEAIAKAIGRSKTSVYHMMESGQLPGAMLVGGKWCFFPSIFYEAARKASKAAEDKK